MKDFRDVAAQLPMHLALFMAGSVKRRWTGELQSDTRIPPLSARRVKAKGHSAILLDHNILLNSVQAEARGPEEAAVTTGDARAVPLFFGVPERNLPPRDMFHAAISDEMAAGNDYKAISGFLDSFEKEFCRR